MKNLIGADIHLGEADLFDLEHAKGASGFGIDDCAGQNALATENGFVFHARHVHDDGSLFHAVGQRAVAVERFDERVVFAPAVSGGQTQRTFLPHVKREFLRIEGRPDQPLYPRLRGVGIDRLELFGDVIGG